MFSFQNFRFYRRLCISHIFSDAILPTTGNETHFLFLSIYYFQRETRMSVPRTQPHIMKQSLIRGIFFFLFSILKLCQLSCTGDFFVILSFFNVLLRSDNFHSKFFACYFCVVRHLSSHSNFSVEIFYNVQVGLIIAKNKIRTFSTYTVFF